MKKISFFILLIIFSLIKINNSFAQWSNFSEIRGSTTINKIDGENKTLFVYEDYIINVFSGKVLREQRDETTINDANTGRTTTTINNEYFLVDNVVFNNRHTLYRNANSWYNENTKSFVNNKEEAKVVNSYTNHRITTYSEILDKTYDNNRFGNPKPDQEIRIRKYYEVIFHHDTTPPSCNSLKLYDNSEMTQNFSYSPGTWLNTDKFFTIECHDTGSGCKCEEGDTSCINQGGIVKTSPKILGHLATPQASFKDNVGNVNNMCSVAGGVKILYDKRAPKIEFKKGENDFNLNTLTNLEYLTDESGKKYNGIEINGKNYYKYIPQKTFKADENKKININISDLTENGSLYGISGLKEYNINFKRIKNKNNEIVDEVLDDCNTNWSTNDQYNPDGTKNVEDLKNIEINCNANYVAGTYKVDLQAKDFVGNETKVELSYVIYPSDIENSKTLLSVDSNGDNFADNNDFYTYKISIFDKYENPIYGKKIFSINQEKGSITGDFKTIKTNMVNNTGEDAIIEYEYNNESNNNGEIIFKVKSIAPGEFTQRFNFKVKNWNEEYQNNEQVFSLYKSLPDLNSFKKPYKAVLSVDSINPEIGTSAKYTIKINSSESNLSSTSYELNNFKNYIKVTDVANTKIENLSDIYNSIRTVRRSFLGRKSYKDINFDLRINTSQDTNSLGEAGIKIENGGKSPIQISYNLGGKNITHFLTSSYDDYSNNNYLEIVNSSSDDRDRFVGINIVGNLQGESSEKQEITGQESNFTDLSKSELRTTIRKNAYEYISSMNSGDIIKGVKYVEGDLILNSSSNLGYETLIVKNGNVIINGNITQNKFGIIVLKDGYNINTDFNDKGNIFIDRNVTRLNALIYADGGVISSKNTIPYTTDSQIRTSELNKQLIINGSLFTRNTVGGAILAGGDYILPGGSKTNNFNNAMIYDLNYLRRGYDGCELDESRICINKYGTVIKYNDFMKNNPPKLFTE